ncbi:MAG: DUF3306 domain-containing protein [Janthinobacterium lividum]
MSGEGFFRRWARLKSAGETAEREAVAPPAGPALQPSGQGRQHAPQMPQMPQPGSPALPPHAPAPGEASARPLPTLEDAARLTPDADFSAFVARDVDKSVQRLALKKLFADPHFNTIDGLDMYMGDYNTPSPLPAAMLASLKHAPDVLGRLFGDQQEGRQEARQEYQQDQEHQQQGVRQPGVHHEAAAGAMPQADEPAPSTQQGNA